MQAQQPKGLKDAANLPEKQRQVSHRAGTATERRARPFGALWSAGSIRSSSIPTTTHISDTHSAVLAGHAPWRTSMTLVFKTCWKDIIAYRHQSGRRDCGFKAKCTGSAPVSKFGP